MPDSHDLDSVAFINEHLGGYNRAMGLKFTRISADEVEGEVVISDQHLQPYGVVHGGVHAGLIEAACSTGAAIVAMQNGQAVVGVENSTSFLRAARSGTLRVSARPIARGRRTQVWEATVRDAEGRALAAGRVRLMTLEAGEALAGKKTGL